MRVLLVEDDAATAQSIELMLKAHDFNVYTTDLGEEGIDLGKLYDYDIILLDLNLPDVSGYEVLRTLRMTKIETPVLILSGLAGVEDKVRGFGFGADDYMTKPFHRDELLARINAVVRRSRGFSQSLIQVGAITIDIDRKVVEVEGERVHLTGKEYQMLELFALRKGMTLSKEMFLNHLYGGRDEPELKIVDVFICKLRRKLSVATGGITYIETVWGRGYALREPDAHQLEQQKTEPIEPPAIMFTGDQALRLRDMLAPLRGQPRPAQREPGNAKGRRNRQAILEAARDLFLVDGFEGSTIGNVVADAGTSTGLIQYYFGNKAGLGQALLDELDALEVAA